MVIVANPSNDFPIQEIKGSWYGFPHNARGSRGERKKSEFLDRGTKLWPRAGRLIHAPIVPPCMDTRKRTASSGLCREPMVSGQKDRSATFR